ncbi:MAG TPA: ornithine carbamoyltransferase [Verrucomicrobiales bacterium]|jgi:ornithine carbamoyltransferase|nr:ornithine carbamoyltransferase [Verrucomicrobiales bacterium]
MKHLLSLQSLSARDMRRVLELAMKLKQERKNRSFRPLEGQSWAMIFTKASTRTRVSFEVGVRELGGHVLYLSPRDTQSGRGEPVEDTARVLGRMVHGAIIRTYAQRDVEQFAAYSGIPTINALTDEEHPCQVLSDLQTMMELCGGFEGKKVVYFGDGDNNMARSWMWAAEKLEFQCVICAPEGYQPTPAYMKKFRTGNVSIESHPSRAVKGADVLYTDVWVSMGMEDESAQRMEDLRDYQINAALVKKAKKDVLVMHCLPAYREKEITAEVLEAHADTIFQEAENRLHTQKAILALLAGSQGNGG